MMRNSEQVRRDALSKNVEWNVEVETLNGLTTMEIEAYSASDLLERVRKIEPLGKIRTFSRLKAGSRDGGDAHVRYLARQRMLKPVLEEFAAERAEAKVAAFHELASAVAEIQANNPKLKQHEAVLVAYRRDPGLFERVREARRANAM